MTRAPHQVVLASAGTGKTFRLAKRYLELLVGEEADPAEILATTFTRKAAQEILARILQWLAQGAGDDEGFAALTGTLYADGDPPRHWSQEELRRQLRGMTGALHRLQVRTLDSWFVARAQLLGLDLGLRPDWTLADPREDEATRLQAVTAALDELRAGELSELLSELQAGEFTRSVRTGLLNLLDEGLELVRDSERAAWERVASPAAPADEDWEAVAERLQALPLPQTKAGKPRSNWRKNVDRILDGLRAGDAEAVLGATPVQRVAAGVLEFDGVAIEPDFQEVLGAAAGLAARVLLRDLARHNRTARRLMEVLEGCYERGKQERARMTFDDLPRRIAVRADAAPRRAAEEFRSGARIRHLLLDEFQDTSVMQWRVLAPLIAAVTGDASGERSLFCVGDVKQSIYGWRQGEPRLLGGISDWHDLGDPETMARSWRSAQTVLDAVHRVFGALGAGVTTAGLDERVAERWRAGWQRHEAARALAGAVSVQVVAKDDAGKEALARAAAERAEELHRAHPHAEIGILVRSNREAGRVLYELDRRGVAASGEGGSELTDARSVQAALSLFRLADHPGNTMAAYHVAGGPFAAFAGLRDEEDDFAAAARRASARLRRRILEDGPGPLLDDVLAAVREEFTGEPWERERFAQLVELAHGFGTRGGLRPREFLRHVEATRVENPVPAPVRVMTIHAAKGLEFDAVVLPLAHGGRGGGGRPFLARRPDPRGGYEAVSRAPGAQVLDALCAADAELDALVQATVARTQTEELCVLYVAMTRAKRRLDVLLEEPRKNPSSLSMAELVGNAFGVGAAEEVWRAGDEEDALAPVDAAAGMAEAEAVDPAQLRLAAAAGTRARPRWTPSGGEAEGALDGARLFLRGGEEARARGTAVHRLFEEVEWLEDFAADDATLAEVLAHEDVGAEDAARAVADFRAALEREAVAAALSRPAESSGSAFEVWREREFAVRAPDPGSGEDGILRGSFDRVVLERDDSGAPVAATVTDFKTGTAEDEGQWAERVAGYRGQMEAYRIALGAMTGLAADAIRLELLFVDAGRVESVDASGTASARAD